MSRMSGEFALYLARNVVRAAARYLIREIENEIDAAVSGLMGRTTVALLEQQIVGIKKLCALIGVQEEDLYD